MRILLTVTTAAAAIALAGCGGGGAGAGAGRPGDDAGPKPSATGAPQDSGQAAAYDAAVAAFEAGDFDRALGGMRSLAGYRDADARLADFEVQAARETLDAARRKLKSAPQAAVALARTAQKYHATSAGRAFLRRAQRELRRFQARQADDLDKGADDGGPPPGAGPRGGGSDGGPPPGAGPPGTR